MKWIRNWIEEQVGRIARPIIDACASHAAREVMERGMLRIESDAFIENVAKHIDSGAVADVVALTRGEDIINAVAEKIDISDEKIVAAMNIDRRDLVSFLDYEEIAGQLDLRRLAREIDADDVANALDAQSIASEIKLDDLAYHLDDDAIAQKVADICEISDETVAEKVAENVDMGDLADKIELDYEALGRALVRLAAKNA